MASNVLAKDDILAIRASSYLRFAVDERKLPITGPAITAAREVTKDGFEQTLFRDIPSRGTIESHGRNGYKAYIAHGTKLVAVECVNSYLPEHRAVCALIRVGDELQVRFVGDNNNDYLRGKSLHADELRLVIVRHEKTFVELTLAYRVCEDNTARMVRLPL